MESHQDAHGLALCRKAPGSFAPEIVDLVQTLANQSVLAIENAELFDQIEQKSRELEAASRHKSEFLANTLRAISLRKANPRERRRYEQRQR